jgi:hypothetical protein
MGRAVSGPLRPLACALAIGALLAPAVVAASEPTRPEYVARLERICKPGSEATQQAVKGVKSDVRHERLRVAAPRVERAQRIFARTVKTISTVARPAADRGTLSRWFAALADESAALGRTAGALHADDPALFARVWGQFVHQGAKANNVVVSFGFNYCDFKSQRFE